MLKIVLCENGRESEYETISMATRIDCSWRLEFHNTLKLPVLPIFKLAKIPDDRER